jgi:acetyl esterase
VVSVFRYLRDHATADGVPGVVAVMGDSAGGNLAAALSIVIRDADEDPPVALGLIYPATDLRMQQPSIDLFADGFYLTKREMVWYRSLYAPGVRSSGPIRWCRRCWPRI